MSWTLYRVTWRLDSPLHSGFAKLGNIQRTRLYVTGRLFWGALTARLTRDQGSGDYARVGQAVNNCLAFSYGYLSLTPDGGQTLLPRCAPTELEFAVNGNRWTEREVQRLCLSSYASTALNYRQNAAEEGSLHEVEFVSPRTLCNMYGVDAGTPLYLTAYIAASDIAARTLEIQGWLTALSKLQLGGERTYGFGRISLVSGPMVSSSWWGYPVILSGTRPEVSVDVGESLLAHVDGQQLRPLDVEYGRLEPLLGRDTTPQAAFGKDIRVMGVYWQPGTMVQRAIQCQIISVGLWRTV